MGERRASTSGDKKSDIRDARSMCRWPISAWKYLLDLQEASKWLLVKDVDRGRVDYCIKFTRFLLQCEIPEYKRNTETVLTVLYEP